MLRLGARRVVRGGIAAAVAVAVVAAVIPRTPTSPRGLGPARLVRYADTGVLAYGSAAYHGSPVTSGVSAPIVAMAATPRGTGYWLASANGRVYAYGTAGHFGPGRPLHLAAPVAGIASTADGRGYWLATAAGGVYAYGDAVNRGSAVQAPVRSPIVSITSTRDGGGYWLLSADGGVHAFGDATWHGGLASIHLTSAAVGLIPSADSQGYWVATSAGAVANFGDAPHLFKSAGGRLTNSVSGIAGTTDGRGYRLVASNGTVQAWGDAAWRGDNSTSLPVEPDAAIVSAPGSSGYWVLEPDAFPTTFASPGGGSAVGRRIVAAAASQVAGDPAAGAFCNAYGPCEAWCALFATWAWEAAGVPISRYAFTGYVYDWAAGHTRVLPARAQPAPGDAVVYGTGPWSTATSVHMGIVAQVWRDGFIDTVDGDSGPAAFGHYGVVINGPFLARQSAAYNGVGIYGYALP